jgi:hypothetical protein
MKKLEASCTFSILVLADIDVDLFKDLFVVCYLASKIADVTVTS